MHFRLAITLSIMLLIGAFSDVACQNAESRSPIPQTPTERCIDSENICEQLFKLRVAHNKKEHEEMVTRAEEALKISEELEASIGSNTRISEKDLEKLQAFEKLVKKIRSELGARDSESYNPEKDQDELAEEPDDKTPVDVVSGFKVLRESTVKLVSEIRKSTRFTISAAAIRSSNVVLKLTRMLRFWR